MRTPIPTRPYTAQEADWPQEGKHILAHHEDETIVVYQAYKPAIGNFAIEHGNKLGGPGLNPDRMSWIKPNFLWMMYRSGWGQKTDQEVTLGLRLRRSFFDELLEKAVASSFRASAFATKEEWKEAMATSIVRLQWDPDHAPNGAKVKRRAIQLGLRDSAWHRLIDGEILEVIDMRAFVEEQRVLLLQKGAGAIQTPSESVYIPESDLARSNVKLDAPPSK